MWIQNHYRVLPCVIIWPSTAWSLARLFWFSCSMSADACSAVAVALVSDAASRASRHSGTSIGRSEYVKLVSFTSCLTLVAKCTVGCWVTTTAAWSIRLSSVFCTDFRGEGVSGVRFPAAGGSVLSGDLLVAEESASDVSRRWLWPGINYTNKNHKTYSHIVFTRT